MAASINNEQKKILSEINNFRNNPNLFLERKNMIKIPKYKEEYEKYISSLNKINKLKFDYKLCAITDDEINKFMEDENYENYQIGEELNIKFNSECDKINSALIALDDIDEIEELIPKVISLEAGEKGRNILTSSIYTHIGISYLLKDDVKYILLFFSKKNEDKIIEEKEEFKLNEEENKILEQINKFRIKPIYYLDCKDKVKKRFQNEYETYLKTLKNKPKFSPDKKLCDIAQKEIKKFYEDTHYEPYQINEELEFELNKNYNKNYSALIALNIINDYENIIPQIISKVNKYYQIGREILTKNEYTNIGIALIKKEDNISILLVFKKEIQIIEEQKLSNEQKKILSEINNFRNNPNLFLERKNMIKFPKYKEEYEKYISSLNKINELKIDYKLCAITDDEINKFMEDENYENYQIGEELNIKLISKYDKINSALIALDDIDEIEELIPKIISLEAGEKGRNILTSSIYTHIGISYLLKDDIKYILLFFSKENVLKSQNEESNKIKVKDKAIMSGEEIQIETPKGKNELNIFKDNNNDSEINTILVKKKRPVSIDQSNKPKLQSISNISNEETNYQLNKNQYFCFTSFYKNSLPLSKIEIKSNTNNNIEFYYKNSNYEKYEIYYLNIICEYKTIKLFFNFYDYYYVSKPIELKCNLIGYIDLFDNLSKKNVSLKFFNDYDLLSHYNNLLNLYKADKSLMNPLIMCLRFENVKINQLLKILKLFSDNHCFPLFLKYLKIDIINFEREELYFDLSNYSIFQKLYNVISIYDIENDTKSKCSYALLDLYGIFIITILKKNSLN